MIVRLDEKGYYAVLLQRIPGHGEYFKFIKQGWFELARVLVSWTKLAMPSSAGNRRTITVECKGSRITTLIDGIQVAQIKDETFSGGYVGMTKIGGGRATFGDLEETLLSLNSP